MARQTPQTLVAGTPVTSTIWNNQVSDNLNFLLGLEVNGTALTDLTDGDELYPAAPHILASGSVGAGISNLTISGIPTTYNHLRLMILARTSSASLEFATIRVGNGSVDSGSNYARTRLAIDNATGGFFSEAGGTSMSAVSLGASGGGNLYSTTIIDFPFYSADKFKNVHITHRAAASSAVADQNYFIGGGTWRSTLAITHISFFITSNLQSDSKYVLYGMM